MTAFDLAQRYVGIREIAGSKDHPLIVWWLSLCNYGFDVHDETPWCSAFVNGIAWELRLPRSKSAAARSWLSIGTPVTWMTAQHGDIVVLKRGGDNQPGRDVLNAQGHVGFFGGYDGLGMNVLGGNQNDGVTVEKFPTARVLEIRRIAA